MKIISKALVLAVAVTGLAACQNSPEAENVVANAENFQEEMENAAENVTDAAENTADNLIAAGDNAVEAAENVADNMQ